MKPGYKTTEFYLNIIKQAVGMFITWGFLNADVGDPFVQAIGAALVATVTLITATVDVINYVRQRTDLKKFTR